MPRQSQSRTANHKARSGKPRGRLTAELARAWIVTVINPILDGLRREDFFLRRKNWTWRYSTKGFEYLRSVAEYVDRSYRDNLVEFHFWYPTLGRVIDGRDDALKRLAAMCDTAFQHLLASADFRTAVEQAKATARGKGMDLVSALGTYQEGWPEIFAEYVVNDIAELPTHYAPSRFWREEGATILRTRKSESVRSDFDAVDQAGNKVLDANQHAQEKLASIRQMFTRKFGLPPVPLDVHLKT